MSGGGDGGRKNEVGSGWRGGVDKEDKREEHSEEEMAKQTEGSELMERDRGGSGRRRKGNEVEITKR